MKYSKKMIKLYKNRKFLVLVLFAIILVMGEKASAQVAKTTITVTYNNNTSTSTDQTATFTLPPNSKKFTGHVWGGGGGGGGADYNYSISTGGGGGSGAYSHRNFLIGGLTANITIGKAGAGGGASNSSVSSGGAGGNSKITYNNISITAGGGGGGGGGRATGSFNPVTGSAGQGGTASGGDTNTNGSSGRAIANSGDNGGGAATNSGSNQGGIGYQCTMGQTKSGQTGGGGKATLTFEMYNVYIGTDKANVCSGSSGSATLRVYMPVAGVTYKWYRGSTHVGSGTTYKTNIAGTYTVQAVHTYATTGTGPASITHNPTAGVVLNTSAKTITITSANSVVLYSGTCLFSDCYGNGTLLFKEDFGGNLTTDPDVSLTPLPGGTTTYGPVLGADGSCGSVDGYYTLLKEYQYLCRDDKAWAQVSDHTSPNDPSRGYYMFVNASYDAGQFYELKIDGLCAGVNLYFSAWIVNIINDPDKIQPKLKFVVYDGNNPTGTQLATYNTDIIGPEYTMSNDVPIGKWNRYGFTFPTTTTSVVLKIFNDAPGGNGNDLGLDDIEVRFCTPPVEIYPNVDEIDACTLLQGLYTDFVDQGTFGNNLVYRWEYSTTGNIASAADWSVVPGTQSSSSDGTVSASYTPSSPGYYRLVISSPGSINTFNCRAMSRVIKVNAVTLPEITTSSQIVCAGSSLNMQANITDGTWSSSNTAVATIDPVTGILTAITPGTADIKYAKGCESSPVTITVNALATAANVTANGTAICSGETATLTAGASDVISPVFRWYDSSGTYILEGNSYTTPALAAGSTTYHVSVAGSNYCENKPENRKAVTVTVSPLPQITTAPQDICAGNILNMAVNITGGQWYSSNPGAATVDPATGVLNAVSEGTTNITYTSQSGCTSEAVTISVVDDCQPYIRVNPHIRATFRSAI